MSDETKLPVEGQTTEPPAPSPYEERARAKGWKPKEEFDGDQTDWIDAEEFIKREPLFEKIRNQSKELKEMRKTVDAMANHFQKTVKAEVDRTIAQLKEQRKEAIELGDVNKVEAIDQQIETQKAVATEAKTPEVPAEIKTWMDENKWFNTDSEMKDFAVAYNEQYLRKHPGALEESLKKTTEAVKRAFPDYFKPKENERRTDPPPVEGGGTSKAGNGKGYNLSRLSPDQRRVYDQMVVRHKVLNHDEYFKGLEEIGELQ